ncbi:MAG: DNA polymerase II large subunit [Methanosarcinaceae archaeon]|nr:DNA polymerase II large subunit [Methanosarcinaceae archaeon]
MNGPAAPAASDKMNLYFKSLEDKLLHEIDIANTARKNGEDPKPEVEIPLAKDLADRVENLIGVSGVAEKIRELGKSMNREETALAIGKEIAEGKVGNFRNRDEAVDAAIRVSMAVITEGVVAAPIEGIAEIKIDKNDDGTEYLRIYYSGPIRSAGGTAQALSVLAGDYVRRVIGLDRYKPRAEVVERYAEEIRIYKSISSLQYSPSDEEIKLIVENCPVCIDGDPTEDAEVSGYRNLPEFPSNRVRGGVALVIAEGLILKAPKVDKHVDALGFDGWEFLKKIMKGTKKSGGDDSEKSYMKVQPNDKYMRDLIAGRPLFSKPSQAGGFRLRYGRSRNTSFAAAGMNPAGMMILGEFITNGTQMKVERPGKAAGMAAVDTIEGPAVRLYSGDFFRIDKIEVAEIVEKKIEYIVDVGEILFNYGDFLENNHILIPSPYCFEWWLYDYEEATAKYKTEKYKMEINKTEIKEAEKSETEKNDNGKSETKKDGNGKSEIYYAPQITKEQRKLEHINGFKALELTEMGVTLHPDFTYMWHDVSIDEIKALIKFVGENGEILSEDDGILDKLKEAGKTDLSKRAFFMSVGEERAVDVFLSLPYELAKISGIKTILENLSVFHIIFENKLLIHDPYPFLKSLGLLSKTGNSYEFKSFDDESFEKIKSVLNELKSDDSVECINKLAGIKIMPKALSRIGARMGRPEKSDIRKMSPTAQALFPIGEQGGKLRNIVNASEHLEKPNSKTGEIKVRMGSRYCPVCGKETFKWRCGCGEFTVENLSCRICNIKTTETKCPNCGRPTTGVRLKTLDFRPIYKDAIERLGVRDRFSMIKGVKELMSREKTPEPLEKGILRAYHDIYMFKDGTVRYDMSDIPLTHIRAGEIGITYEKLLELGYEKDIYGEKLVSDEQIVTMFVQDLVVSYDCGEYLLKTTQYIDDLLVRYYGLDPYYNAKNIQDIVGVMVIGLAPHTSAGVLGRIIGFTTASVGFAHPYFHASKRRNCDGDEDCVMLLLDGLLNFSRSYLPDKRGGQMDAPLVLTTRIDPSEIDKEAQNIDVAPRYPREFYIATQNYTPPNELEKHIDLVSFRIGTNDQYENFMFTHDTSNIASGPKYSSYKVLETMEDKMNAQLNLAKKIRAVDAGEVAEGVLKSHFLPDIIGNLRAFSRQTTRCLKCGIKYRRPPLSGTCTKCRGDVILTVHEGAVRKYVEISKKVAEDFDVSSYTKERLLIAEEDIKETFENHKVKQLGLSEFL